MLVKGYTRLKEKPAAGPRSFLSRAGDGTRTHDVQLGKLAFYQLNYARVPELRCRCSRVQLSRRATTAYAFAGRFFPSTKTIFGLKRASSSSEKPPYDMMM